MGLAHKISERVFSRIHGNNLVYNTCWEDPRCDRNLLNMNDQSKVLMLTSAGCNALDYLLDNPAEVHCVDLNPRQNALLQLKMALFKSGSHAALFDFFGTGAAPGARVLFQDVIEPNLSDPYARRYWRRNLRYFKGKGLRRSFYWHGSSGAVAWLVRNWLQSQPGARRLAHQLFSAANLNEQLERYEQLEPRFLNHFIQWLVSQHFIQSMLGVPKSQQHLAALRFPDGMAGYVRACLRHVFTRIPIADNYFWRLYFYGNYSADCCPNYLRPEYFDVIRARVGRIRTYTSSLSSFLKENPGQYSHFILLDHQDWLAAHQRQALEEEWQLILANAAPGAKVLLRSAAFELDFLPDFVREKVQFDLESAEREHGRDRVGTYASTWLGVIHFTKS